MNLPSKEIIDLLTYLLPGFITAAILYSLIPTPRAAPFERIVEALIYTVVLHILVAGTKWTLYRLGSLGIAVGDWSDGAALVWSVVLAAVLGLLLAWLANHDTLYSALRHLEITNQPSYPSEWYGALSRNKGYVVLHLVGQRRIYGFAEEWPNTSDAGHFILISAEWLDGEKRIPLPGVGSILIKASEVEMVEFMKPVSNESTETNHGREENHNTAVT